MAYGCNSKIVGKYVAFGKEENVEVELRRLGLATAVANEVVTFPMSISSPAHFQHIVGQLPTPKTFRMHNQLYLNIPLVLGDSGTCLYIKNYIQTGCLGMAIAFLNGISVVTPMKNIFDKLTNVLQIKHSFLIVY